MLAKLIPTRVHALMDYTVGILLIAAPWIFSFADESSAAKWVSIILGIAVIATSAMTNYEGGFLANVVSMRMHLMTDALVGIVLIVSPWVFGFADDGANAWLPFVLIGVGELGAAAMTNPMPGDRSHRAREVRRTA
jgi:SPW repeat